MQKNSSFLVDLCQLSDVESEILEQPKLIQASSRAASSVTSQQHLAKQARLKLPHNLPTTRAGQLALTLTYNTSYKIPMLRASSSPASSSLANNDIASNDKSQEKADKQDKNDYVSKQSSMSSSNGWQRTLLHMAAERGVAMKIRDFFHHSSPAAANKEQSLELPGDPSHGNKPLHLACNAGHVDAAKALIDLGARVNSPNRDKDTALILATKNGHESVVRLLISSGANILARGCNDMTAIHWACYCGNSTIFDEFLSQLVSNESNEKVKAVLNLRDSTEEGNTPFHLALANNNVAIAVKITAKFPEFIHIKNNAQHTALHLASYHGRVDAVNWLLQQGAKVNAKGRNSATALHKAVQSGQCAIVELLWQHGADMEATEAEIGGNPLHTACKFGQSECLHFLVEKGSSLKAETKLFGFSPIHVAAYYGQTPIVEQLVTRYGLNVDAKGTLGRTALMLSSANGQLSTVEYLCGSGANIEEKDEMLGGTALHFASWFGQISVAEFLLKIGADRCARDFVGDCPLHWAVLNEQLKAVTFLLTRGAETGAKDDRIGRTALHDAASKGFVEIVQLLLSRADIEATDEENGATALHLAAWFGHAEVIHILVGRRAKIEARDRWNRTPLHWSVINNKLESVECLLIHGANLNAKGGKYGRTPLHMAAEWGRPEVADLLLRRGARRESLDDRKKCTALHLAAQFCNSNVVKVLLAHRANSFAQDENGFTPLHLAVRTGQSASVGDMRKWREAELKAKTGLGAKSIEDAVTQGRWAMTEDLLRSQILNQSPMKRMDEASINQSDVITLLIDSCPALLSMTTLRFGRTVLHIAAQAGQLVATQTLISRGADTSTRDKIGKTPLRLAFDNSKYDIVRLFVKLGITE